jgi:hypothetical protein
MSKYKYVTIWENGKRVGDEHRLAMENKLGRKLKRSEFVHHLNSDCKDNRIENLKVMTLSEHTKWHYKNGDIPIGGISKFSFKKGHIPIGGFKTRFKKGNKFALKGGLATKEKYLKNKIRAAEFVLY